MEIALNFLVPELELQHKGQFFHAVRHGVIVDWLKSIYSEADSFKALDLCCAQGTLSAAVAEQFKKVKITAVDGDPRVLMQKAVKPYKNQITTVWENVLYPANPEKWISDVVIFCEVCVGIINRKKS